jgi:GNAT superfamily N-acetyltransferase
VAWNAPTKPVSLPAQSPNQFDSGPEVSANPSIREAVAGDAIRLKACMESAYAAYQDRLGGARLPPMDVDYSSEIKNYPCWVVESAGEILGGLIMTFAADRAQIANIAIVPQVQGKGIGGKLMKFAESEAGKRGFSELHLTTHAMLIENISLYRHLGWKQSGKEANRVYMQKKL